MSPFEVFDEVFGNLLLFLALTIFFVFTLYVSVRKITAGGYFDPLHFYWAFTYGTAYALIAGLYVLGHISLFYVVLVFSLGLLLVVALRLFLLIPTYTATEVIIKACQPNFGMRSLLSILVIVYIFAVIYQISVIGFGMFASTNRFEQARGNGVIIRFLGAIVPFLVAACSIYLYKIALKKKGLKDFMLLCFYASILFLFMVFNSILDGSKAAILFYLYAAVLGVALYTHKKPRFYFFRLSILFVLVLFFALLVQSFDLKNQNLKSSNAQYLPESSFALERLIFRVIGNGDKYYLGLPNEIVENIEVDNFLVRFAAPIVGSTNLSRFLGYNVNNYDVGRQILLQHTPDRETAGGPTSHFDLFAYKYFGLSFCWVWVVFSAFIMATIVKVRVFSCGSVFVAAIGTQLWLSGLSILLEPPIGIAKILDVLIIFGLIKLLGYILPKKTVSPLVEAG
nr:O-antigen polymerase [Pseudomonas sp.]